ncbi:MAG: hypothetical protein ACR2M1_16855, partial [Gemmatimonadaceae bacterium]
MADESQAKVLIVTVNHNDMLESGPALLVTGRRHPLIAGIISFLNSCLIFFGAFMLIGGFTHEDLNRRFNEHLFVSAFTALTFTLGMYFLGRWRRGKPETGNVQ